MFAGCAHDKSRAGRNWGAKVGTETVNHIVMVNKYGWPVPPFEDKAFTNRAAYLSHFTNVVNHVLATAPERDGKKQILIFAHGGLNSRKDRLRRASDLLERVDGIRKDYNPVFLNWDSGFGSTYWEHLISVRHGRLANPIWGKATAPFLFLGDMGRGFAGLPSALLEQGKLDVQSFDWPYGPWHRNALLLLQELHNQENTNVTIGCARLQERSDPHRGVVWALSSPAKLLTTPVVAGGGPGAWRNMRRRTKTMYRNPGEFNPLFEETWRSKDERLIRGYLAHDPRGGVSEFMSVLSAKISSEPRTQYEVTLVAHSMGAIILSEVLRKYTNLFYKDIVFMAPACSIRDFETSVVPYMSTQPETRFYNLCLHPLAEAQEDFAFPVVPRGSLLHWIDNYLDSPEFPTDRTLGAWENIVLTYKVIPPALRPRVFIKSFNNEQAPRNPFRHGDFDNPDMEFWKPDFWRATTCECTNCQL